MTTRADGSVSSPAHAGGEFTMGCEDPGAYAEDGERGVDPTGPPGGDRRVLRGGSYLCHASYRWRYRTAARTGSRPDSPRGNTGFRCAQDAWAVPQPEESR